jgi:hypothetical protein
MSLSEWLRTLAAIPAGVAMSLAGDGESPRVIGLLVGVASITAGVVLLQAGRALR